MCHTEEGDGYLCSINLTLFGTEYGININPLKRDYFNDSETDEQTIKPYLRPMSSMTEEEFGFLQEHLPYDFTRVYSGKFNLIDDIHIGNSISIDDMAFLLECLNKWHFDYRGLIKKVLLLKHQKICITKTRITMQQFNLDIWLQDKSRKVVTRDGKQVRIVCWDRNTTYWKIIGLVTSPDGSTENPYTYDVNGNESDGCLHDHKNDLFFADEEKRLSKFEKVMIQFSHERNSLIQFEHTVEEINAHLYLYYKKLLDLARKELQPEFEKEFYRGFSIGQNSNEIIKAYKNGKTEVLNSLPKLKKSTLPISDEEYPTGFNGKYFCYKGYCIDYKKLFEILPKEE